MSSPDWSGETCVIVGTGPSASGVPLIEAKGKARFIAIKRSWMLCPWADVLYGIDRGWWIANQGIPEFKGLKVTPSPSCARAYGMQQVRLRPRAELSTKPGTLGCGLPKGGGFAGFQVINLAYQYGARRHVLVGFDMTLENGAHWHNDYRGVARPDRVRTQRWREALDGCAGHFATMGLEVINASRNSRLAAFPKADFSALWRSEPESTRSTATSIC